MALLLRRRATTNAFIITNPSLLRRLLSTGDDQPPSNSNSRFASFADSRESLMRMKEKLRKLGAERKEKDWFPNKLRESLMRMEEYQDNAKKNPSSPLTDTNPNTSSLQQIQHNLSELRRRTAAPPPSSAQNPDDSSSSPAMGIGNSDLKDAKPNRGRKSLAAIREELLQMETDGKDRMSSPFCKNRGLIRLEKLRKLGAERKEKDWYSNKLRESLMRLKEWSPKNSCRYHHFMS